MNHIFESYTLEQWILLFFFYSFCGYLWEVFYVSLRKHHLTDRGFLYGPILPIYGSGALIILLATIPVKYSVPLVFICGLLTCILVEKFKLFGYGEKLPEEVWQVLADLDRENAQKMSKQDKVRLSVQGLIAIWLILGLAFHLAAVGLIGLSVIILATTFTGVTDEHAIGKAFQESLPFTALLVVFFSIVAVIIDQKLFGPIIHFVLSAEEKTQLALFYGFNGLLSAISIPVLESRPYMDEYLLIISTPWSSL